MCSNKLLDKTVITPPVEEPVTLEEMKTWASIDYDEKNMTIQGMIVAAREMLEEKYDIGIAKKTIRAIVDNSCGGIEITGSPIGNVTGFDRDGGDVELSIIGVGNKFIESPCACYLEIEYESGYDLPDTPMALREAIKQQVLWMLEHLGEEDFDTQISPMAAMSLKPFRRNGTGIFI
ncbi:hypothetical protein [Chitinophaga sp. MM2321]|uniref:hypothetical protein n=1 Tax=Chitinophaga sp. MM2321 TaxID=3137178 RepID=UPI0032D58416